MRPLWLPAALALALSPAALSAELVNPDTGVHFPVDAAAGGEPFRCIGTGVRKVFLFKVYAVAFCLPPGMAQRVVQSYARATYPGLIGPALASKLADDQGFFDALANAPGDKLVEMHMVRDVSRGQLANAFRDSLSKILPKAKVATLVAAIPADARSGTTALIYSRGGELMIDIGGQLQRVKDPETAHLLWRVWLGPDSVSPSLKHSIAEHAVQATALR